MVKPLYKKSTVSLLSPKHIRLGLGATYAALARVRGNQVIAWRMQRFEAATSGPAWQPALNLINAWMAELAPRRATVKVTLSSALARLDLLPWRDDVMRGDQQVLLAQSHFRRIFGEPVEDWQTSVHATGYGNRWLASGVDGALLISLTASMRKHAARQHAVLPLSISLFNGFQQRLQGTACWLLVAEPENLVAMHFRHGRWQLLRTLPIASLGHEPLHQTLSRETRLAGLADSPAELFVIDSAMPANLADSPHVTLDRGWQADTSITAAGGEPLLHLLGSTL